MKSVHPSSQSGFPTLWRVWTSLERAKRSLRRLQADLGASKHDAVGKITLMDATVMDPTVMDPVVLVELVMQLK